MLALGAKDMFGMTGTIETMGTFGFCGDLLMDLTCGRVGIGVLAEEGVVGCVDSASEGACEVDGVSRFD